MRKRHLLDATLHIWRGELWK